MNQREGRDAKGWVGAVHLLVILYILCNNKLVIYYIQSLESCVCVDFVHWKRVCVSLCSY